MGTEHVLRTRPIDDGLPIPQTLPAPRAGHRLVVGAADDPAELEADRIAGEVVAGLSSEVPGRPGWLPSSSEGNRIRRRDSGAAMVRRVTDPPGTRRGKRKAADDAGPRKRQKKDAGTDYVDPDSDAGAVQTGEPSRRSARIRNSRTPEALEAKKQKAKKTMDAEFLDEEGFAADVHDNPAGYALLDGEVGEFEQAVNEREFRADETRTGTRGGMSGEARSDKGEDALAAWLHHIRPASSRERVSTLFKEHQPIRWTRVDRDDAVVSERTPTQSAALSHLPAQDRESFAQIAALIGGPRAPKEAAEFLNELQGVFRSNVSANKVLVHKKPKGDMDRGGFEILHMSGRAVGNPILALPKTALDELIGDQSMERWTANKNRANENFTPAQHPGNLAIGSFAANTMMMALEGAVTSVDKGFSLETWAYAPRGSQHVASHIVMKIEHNPTKHARWYYIPGTGGIAPADVYAHMAADATAFMQEAATPEGPSGPAVYEYPTAADLLAQRDLAAKALQAEAAKATTSGDGDDAETTMEMDDVQIAQPTINAHGTTLYLNQTAGAGNCFFHALFEAQTETRSTTADQQAQREAVLDALHARPRLTTSHFLGADTIAFNKFVTTLLLEGSWVGNQTPGIIADALDVRITIHNPDGSIYTDFVPNAAIGSRVSQVVHLYYDGGHYNSYTKRSL